MSKQSSSFASNVLKLVSGNALAQGLLVLVAPVLTRLFAPDAFGVAALFTSITGIVTVAACLRYELSIMLPKSNEEASNLFGLSLFFVTITAGTIVLIVLLAGDHVAQLLNSPELRRYLWLVPIAVFVNGVFLALNYWNSRSKRFGRLSMVRVVSSIIAESGCLGAGFLGFISGGVLIAARVIGQLVSTAVLGVQILREDHNLFTMNVRWDKMIVGLKRYKKFPIYNIWSALLNTSSQFLPSLFLAYFFSPKIVGYYALGLQVLFLPTSLIGQAVGQVFFQKASEAKHQNRLDIVVEGVFRRLVSLGMFPFLLLVLLGSNLFRLIFGSQWSEAGFFAQTLSPWVFSMFVYSPLTFLFIVLEAQKEGLVVDSILFVCRCLALFIGGISGDPRIAVALFSLVGTIIVSYMVFWIFSKVGVKPRKVMIIFRQYLIMSSPALLTVLWSQYVMKNPFFITLGIGIFWAILYYSLVGYLDGALRMQFMTLLNKLRNGN